MLQNSPQVSAKIQRQKHSLDTIVAALYVVKHPKGLRTVVLGGALANSKVWHF